jgi:hypothetical protein
MKEKLPALLASKEGLSVACGLFSLLEAKDRKIVVKALPINEMAIKKIAHLFLVHITNTLDDTQLTKKKILHEALKNIDDLISDKNYQSMMVSALLPAATATVPVANAAASKAESKSFTNQALTAEDKLAFAFMHDMTTSKKDANIRTQEIFTICQKPLSIFFEEKLSNYLCQIKEHPVFKQLIISICFCKLTFLSLLLLHKPRINLFFSLSYRWSQQRI